MFTGSYSLENRGPIRQDIWKDIREAGYKIQELYTHPSQGGMGIGVVYV